MAGMQSSAGSSPCFKKNLHLAPTFLCPNFTVHTPKNSISDRVYVFNITEFIFCYDYISAILETEF